MEEVKRSSGQNMGIAALIMAIITFVFAIIPCIGIIAIIPGIIAIVLASVGLSQASGQNRSRGVLTAALILGILAVLISFSQVYFAGRIIRHTDKWPSEVRSAVEEIRRDIRQGLEDANVSIRIDSINGTVEVNKRTNGDSLLRQLEKLESGTKEKNDTLKKEK